MPQRLRITYRKHGPARKTLDWDERRGDSDSVRRYDLHSTVIELVVRERDERVVLEMQLALEDRNTGSPASVLAALGVEPEPLKTVRTSVDFERPQVATRKWRERGRFEQ